MLNPNQDDHVDRFLEVERSVVLPVSPYPRRYTDTRLKGDRRFITLSISFSFFSDIPWLPLKRSTLRDELKGKFFSSKVAPEFVILLSAFDRKKNKNKKVEIFWRKKKKRRRGKQTREVKDFNFLIFCDERGYALHGSIGEGISCKTLICGE